jgi:hypothetical protein
MKNVYAKMVPNFWISVFTYTKVQVPLLGMKYGGIGPLKLLFCTSLFHIVESPMSQLV